MRQSRNDIAIPPDRFLRHRTMTILLRSLQSSSAEQFRSLHVADINRFSYDAVHRVLGNVCEHDLHAKRIESLCNATIGVLHSASLAVSAIGHGLGAARGLSTKQATEQINRLLSNDGIKVDDILWCQGNRSKISGGSFELESAEFSATFWRPVTCAHSRRATVR
jgi:hypothetical protein